MKLETEFENKNVIPNPGDKDTRLYTSFERIRDRLPSTEGKAGKYLKVGSDEEHCEWVTGGGGGTGDYNDLTNKPSVNSVELTGNKTLSDLGIQQEIEKKQNKVFFQNTEPTDAVPGDLWCSEGTESVSFASITGNATDNASLAAELGKKVAASGYPTTDYGKHLGIGSDGTVLPVASGGELPAASQNGTAAVYCSGAWKAQTGYAVDNEYVYGTKVEMSGKAFSDVGWITFTGFTIGERIEKISSLCIELDGGYLLRYPRSTVGEYFYFGAPVDDTGSPIFTDQYPVCIRVSKDGNSSWFGLVKEAKWILTRIWDDEESLKFNGDLIDTDALNSDNVLDGPNLVSAINSKVSQYQSAADVGKVLGIVADATGTSGIVTPTDFLHLYIHNLIMTAGRFTLVCQVFTNYAKEMPIDSFLKYLTDNTFISGQYPARIFKVGGGASAESKTVYGVVCETGNSLCVFYTGSSGIAAETGVAITSMLDVVVEAL